MLRRIEINNYKMFRDFKLDFTQGVNMICGPNGGGKSALREVLFSLRNFLAMPDVAEHLALSVDECFPVQAFCRWLPQELGFSDIEILIELGVDTEWFSYSLKVRNNYHDNKSRVHEESLSYFKGTKEELLLSFKSGKIEMKTAGQKTLVFNSDWNMSGLVPGSSNNSNIKRFGALVSRIFAMHLDPSVIANDFHEGTQTLGELGENFSAWHFYQMTTNSEKINQLTEECKNFIPGFVSVNSPKSGDLFRLKIRVQYNDKSYELALRELSDGQKILFALYSLLTYVPDGSTILIDEPENFLAPSELQPWLNAVNDAWEEHDIQFVLITHNPKTLNWHHKEAVIFSIVDEPPRIIVEKNDRNSNTTLFERLAEMEWSKDG